MQCPTIIKRLNKDNYNRPPSTLTEKLTEAEINEKLDDYVQVKDIYKVPLGTHLRYFKIENGEEKFRMGGILSKNIGLPKYIVLSNGVNSWSVQTANTVFYRKMTPEEIKQSYEDTIEDLELKNENLRGLVNHLKEEIKKLKSKR